MEQNIPVVLIFRTLGQRGKVLPKFRNLILENFRSIWFITRISGIFGRMESAQVR